MTFTVTTVITLEDFEADIDVAKEAIENAITQNVPTIFNEHGQSAGGDFDDFNHQFTINSITVTTVRKQVLR